MIYMFLMIMNPYDLLPSSRLMQGACFSKVSSTAGTGLPPLPALWQVEGLDTVRLR